MTNGILEKIEKMCLLEQWREYNIFAELPLISSQAEFLGYILSRISYPHIHLTSSHKRRTTGSGGNCEDTKYNVCHDGVNTEAPDLPCLDFGEVLIRG
jgi:hypothetical protein